MLAKKNIELDIYDVNLAKKHEMAPESVEAHTAAGLKIPLSARFEFSVLQPMEGSFTLILIRRQRLLLG